MRSSSHIVRWLCPAILFLVFQGCVEDQVQMVHLEFDSPVFQPALSLPADSARSVRLSLWGTRPTERSRQGYYDTGLRSGSWFPDTIPGPDGTGMYVVHRYTTGPFGTQRRFEDTEWHLPNYQIGAFFEVPLTPDSYIGFGGQASSSGSGRRWMLEGRISTDLPEKAPSIRLSAGVFYGKQDLSAAFIRQIDEGSPLVSWAHGTMATEGYFGEVVLGPPMRHAAVAPFLAITGVHQRLFTHGVPSPDPRFGTFIAREWFALWTFSPGIVLRLSPTTDLIVSPRIVYDTSIDVTKPTSFLLPIVQLNVRL